MLQHGNQLHCLVLSKVSAKNPTDAPSCLLRTLGHTPEFLCYLFLLVFLTVSMKGEKGKNQQENPINTVNSSLTREQK